MKVILLQYNDNNKTLRMRSINSLFIYLLAYLRR